jgi:hypothetical protein
MAEEGAMYVDERIKEIEEWVHTLSGDARMYVWLLLRLVNAQTKALGELANEADEWHNARICGCDYPTHKCALFRAIIEALRVYDLEGLEEEEITGAAPAPGAPRTPQGPTGPST